MVNISGHLCSAVGVFAACNCSCVNTREIPGRLDFDSAKAPKSVASCSVAAAHRDAAAAAAAATRQAAEGGAEET